MAISKEVLDELMKEYKGPDDFYGPDGLIKQLSKALIERAMQTELTEQLGYKKVKPVKKKQKTAGMVHQQKRYEQIRGLWK